MSSTILQNRSGWRWLRFILLFLILMLGNAVAFAEKRGEFKDDVKIEWEPDSTDANNCIIRYRILYHHGNDDSGFRVKGDEDDAHGYGCWLSVNGTKFLYFYHEDDYGVSFKYKDTEDRYNDEAKFDSIAARTGFRVKKVDYYSEMMKLPYNKHEDGCDNYHYSYLIVELLVPYYLLNTDVEIKAVGKWWRWGTGWEDEEVKCPRSIKTEYKWKSGGIVGRSFSINEKGEGICSWNFGFDNASFLSKVTIATDATTPSSSKTFDIGDVGYKREVENYNFGMVNLKYDASAKHHFTCKLNMPETVKITHIDKLIPRDSIYSLKERISEEEDTMFYYGFPYIKENSVVAEFDKGKREITLSWAYVGDVTLDYVKTGRWVIERTEKRRDGTKKTIILDEIPLTKTTYQDLDVEFQNEYSYEIYYFHNDWDEKKQNDVVPELKGVSKTIDTKRTVTTNISAVGHEDFVELQMTIENNSDRTDGLYNAVLLRDSSQILQEYNNLKADETELVYRDVRGVGNELNSRTGHKYILEVRANYPAENSNEIIGSAETDGCVLGGNGIDEVEASFGDYSDKVTVSWRAVRPATDLKPDTFNIYRRQLERDKATLSEFVFVNKVVSADRYLSYDDIQPCPGEYYEYKVEIVDGDGKARLSKTTIGYATSTGVVSGNITYQNGTALANALVTLKPAVTGEGDMLEVYQRSVRVNMGGGLKPSMPVNKYNKVITGNHTVQFWVRPVFPEGYHDGLVARIPGVTYNRLLVDDNVGDGQTNGSADYVFRNDKGDEVRFNGLPSKDWIYVSSAYDNGKQFFRIGYYDKNDTLVILEKSAASKNESANETLNFGTSFYTPLCPRFFNLDELQVWSRALSAEEVKHYCSMSLSGKEDGLFCYLPFDEGLTTMAFDHAYEGNSHATNHAVFGPNITTDINSAPHLNICAYTQEKGNYMISGIPYRGDGTVYTIAPAYGGHEFLPSSVNRFVSANSSVFTNVDFVDNSSFSVKGTATYRYGDFPVEGAELYIDGVQAKRAGMPILTDAEGRYELDVPVGNHYLSIRKENHGFQYEGRFPAEDGQYYDFQSALNGVNFVDTTMVVIAGRVAGGHNIAQKSLAAGIEGGSRANIGQATLYLSPVSNRNYVVNTSESETITMPGDSLSHRVQSITRLLPYERNGAQIAPIEIKTDPRTGEFRALLPPLKYNIVYGYTKTYGNDELQAYNAAQINPVVGKVYKDSLLYNEVLGSDTIPRMLYSAYNTKTIIQYDSRPEFLITTLDDNLALGEPVVDIGGKEISAYDDQDPDDIQYTFGYPVFKSGETYYLKVRASQKFYNDDYGNMAEDELPLNGAIVSFRNSEWCTSDTRSDVEIHDGFAVYSFEANKAQLDEDKFTNNMSISIQTATRTYKYPEEGNMQALFTGFMSFGSSDGTYDTGNMLLVGGPSIIEFVLRDPPGSDSYSTLESGSTRTSSISINSTSSAGSSTAVNMGAGVGIKMSWKDDKDWTGVTIGGLKVQDIHKESYGWSSGHVENNKYVSKTTTTTNITTGSDPLHVGAGGDVYIGRNSVIAVGKAQSYGFYDVKPSDGCDYRTFTLDSTDVYLYKKEVHGATMAFDDSPFVIDQRSLETTMLPNLRKFRNELLHPKGTKDSDLMWNDSIHVQFISLVDRDNPDFASVRSAYEIVKNPNISESSLQYVDSILTVNGWIENWEDAIRLNEQKKVKGNYDNIVAISSGIPYSMSTSQSDGITSEISYQTATVSGTEGGINFEFVAYVAINLGTKSTTSSGSGSGNGSSESLDNNTKVSFTIKDSDPHDYFSIGIDDSDVMNQGYMFRVKGGASTRPWEGPEYTQYYNPGRGVLSEGTLKVDKPRLSAKVTEITDIPNGREVSVVLQLANESEIHAANEYILIVDEASNPDGLQITCDGYVMTGEGHKLNFGADESYTKVLKIKQTRLDVMDYNNVTLMLRSPNYQALLEGSNPDLNAKTSFSLHFKPSCSDVSLEALDTLNNKTLAVNLSTSDKVVLRASNYDRKYNGFYKLALQRKGELETQWHTIHEWALTDSIAKVYNMNESIGNRSSVSYTYDMHDLADQKYMFRAVTHGKYGTEEVTFEGDTVSVVKDVKAPQVMAISPADGILTADKDVSVLFNEDIFSTALVSSNIKVTGILNEQDVNHDYGLYFHSSDKTSAHTTADVAISGNFGVEMWLSGGATVADTVFTHTQSNGGLAFGFNKTDQLWVSMNSDSTYVSDQSIRRSGWSYLSINFNDKEKKLIANMFYTDNKGVAHQDEILNVTVPSGYNSVGHVYLGRKFEGMLSDVTIWNTVRDMTDMADRNKTRSGREAGLLACWPMNEGHGLVAADKTRGRNLVVPNDNMWFVKQGNYAAHFNGTDSYLKTGAVAMNNDEDFAMEFWFLAKKKDGTLVQMGDNAIRLSDGVLTLESKGNEPEPLCGQAIDDGSWHHFAMNVIRNASANFYVDGKFTAYVDADLIKQAGTSYYIVGAHEIDSITGAYTDYLNGSMDELRVWKATQNSKALLANRYCHVDSTALGLVMSYQFDHSTYMTGTQVWSVQGDTYDHSPMKLESTAHNIGLSTSGPRLTGINNEELVSFDWVASKDKVVISITEPKYRIEDRTLNFSIDRVQDMNGNTILTPVKWSAFVDCNRLQWSQPDVDLHAVYLENSNTATVDITNSGDEMEQWTIDNVPSWLELSQSGGSLSPMSTKHITFSALEGVPVGNYEDILYLVGNSGVREPLAVSLSVTGSKPDWSVNPADFEYQDNITARLEIGGFLSENKEDMIAAFVGDVCVGVGHPLYIESMDNYLVMMTLYSDSILYADGSQTGPAVSFKAWSAANGRVYPLVNIYDAKGNAAEVKVTRQSSVYGTPNAPWQLKAENAIQQNIDVVSGWKWITINVTDLNGNMAFNHLIPEDDTVNMVKSQSDGSAEYSRRLQRWTGNLSKKDLSPTKMYMVRSDHSDVISLIGKPIVSSELPDTIVHGWNWIGYSPQDPIDLTTALAGANPVEGDIVKGQRMFAYYTQNQWVGTMDYLEPGCGYNYYSNSNEEKLLHYPDHYNVMYNRMARRTAPKKASQTNELGWTWNPHLYSGNMTVTANVYYGSMQVYRGIVGAFDEDGVCRGYQDIEEDSGMLYLIISGDEACNLDLVLWDADTRKTYRIPAGFTYSTNQTVGGIDDPAVLQFDPECDGITDIIADADQEILYDLGGRKVQKPIVKGIYVSPGKKTIKK